MFVVGLIGDTVEGVSSALGHLAGCSLSHALQLPHQAALQPQGWMWHRCRCYQDEASGTLWVGVAVAALPRATGGPTLSRVEAREQEAEAIRALLLLFLTSHAVLWLHEPQALLSTEMLRQLRLLQQLKSALMPALPQMLGVAPREATSAMPGLCIPQLFVLVQPPLPVKPQQGQLQQSGAAEMPGMAAEDLDHHPLPTLLKRCRVLQPDNGARALCTLPAAGSPLLLLPEHLGSGSQEQLVAEALAGLLAPPHELQQQPQHQSTSAVAAKPVSEAATVAAALAPQRSVVAEMVAADGPHTDALVNWRHAVATLAAVLEAAAAPPPAGSAAPAATVSATAELAAADMSLPPEAAAAAAWQTACSRAAYDFSYASCKRAAAVASDAYRRNTPVLLPAAGHAVALQAALRLYHSLARGPAAAAGAEALTQQLDAYWKEGHMQCDAVSFLGNPCCLPAHDPQQQPHASSGASSAAGPHLLLASGSGAQQHAIPEPFTVAELQRAAAAVASDSGSAVARTQFYVRRLAASVGAPAADADAGSAAGLVGPAKAADTVGAAAGSGVDLSATGTAAEAGTGLSVGLQDAAEARGGRERLSGDGHSSGGGSQGEEEGLQGAGAHGVRTAAAKAGSDVARDAAAAVALLPPMNVGVPASGCWLELHVLGPRSMYKSPALAAALLMDGQPGWLRSGGVMLASLAVQVAVPLKPGEQAACERAPAQGPAPEEEEEEFPSLQQMKQQQQRQRQQRRRPGGKRQEQQRVQQAKDGAAQGAVLAGKGERQEEVLKLPALLTWPGWHQPAAAPTPARAPLFVAATSGARQAHRTSKQRAGKPPLQLASGGLAMRGPASDIEGPAASAAAEVAAGAASVELASVLMGFEYESVEGQRLLLTPSLLATVLQSSLDTVAVRQHSQQPPAAQAGKLQPKTAAAVAAAAATAPAATAAFLLQQDLPLWLQLPAEHLARLAGTSGSKRRSAPTQPAASLMPSSGGSQKSVWLQLRRVFIGTPDVAIQLEAQPKLHLEVPSSMLAPTSAPAIAPPTGGSTSAASPAVQLEYSLAAPLALPSGSFCVLALPWLLTAPMDPIPSPSSDATGSGGSRPAALIRQSGPLRAVLLGCCTVRPKGAASDHY